MILFFYNLALALVLVAGTPWWLWRMAMTHKYREGLLERLGRVPGGSGRMFKGKRTDRPLIWIHAVSVGEVLAISRLIKTLDTALPGYFIAISTTTRTGQTLARERFGRERVFYCPLDFPWAVRAYLNALRPRMLVLSETEFWPNLLQGCFRRGIPVAVVNARISDRSWPRYRRMRKLWRPILKKLSRVLAQSEIDAERLRTLGCTEERLSVAGNLKFDVQVPGDSDANRQLRQRAQGLKLVVAASTLEGEEAALLGVWPRLLEAEPQLVMVLAPRHPERFNSVAGLLDKSGARWVRRSEWRKETSNPGEPATIDGGQIVLLDTIGELASIYSLAELAFVGGSLIRTGGGHNPLEPAQFGVPIVMGPNYPNFRAIVEELLAHEALCIAHEDTLAATLLSLLGDRKTAEAMGARACEVFAMQAGATERCVSALRGLLGAGEPQEQRT